MGQEQEARSNKRNAHVLECEKRRNAHFSNEGNKNGTTCERHENHHLDRLGIVPTSPFQR